MNAGSKKGLKKGIALLLVIAMLLATLTGCGGDKEPAADDGEARTDLVYALSAEPNKLDPMAIAMMSTFTITYAIYDNLVEENENGEFVPCLAEKVDISDDEKVYTFTLRQGVKFHDGSEMTADDVVFSINRTIEKGWAFDMTAFIDKVEKVDDYTVEMTLNTPFGGMMGSLASPYFSIMSKNYLETNGDEIADREPMGTGAYKFVEWVSGDHISLEANEDYFQGAPAIKNITFKPITDKNTGLISLQTGEIDAYLNVNAVDIPTVEEDETLAFYSTELAAVLSLNMNVEVEPLDNPDVRRAINYALNRQSIIDGALEGRGTIANSSISPTCDGYSENVKAYEYDVEKAKELLKGAGYDESNPLKLTIKLKEDAKNQKVAQVIQNDLKQANIEVEIDVMEAGAYTTDIYSNGNYEMTISSWCAMFPDAYSLLYSQFHKDCYGGTGNITHVMSDELSGKLEEAATKTGDEKIKAYDEVTQMIQDDAYVASLVYEPTTITTSAGLKGVQANTLGIYKVKKWSW
ncbi:MAG: ABC transporter substrate-binding protein [Firmicutes bacterium]|nr:ABC transporter substrate-binding protein [Bacillota bacterium]